MPGFSTPFSGDDEETFDEYDAFGPEHVPEPGAFLDGHDVLDGEDHLAFHDLTRELFEERGVYDMTFGYNLARLNLDRRHPDAGYRYAIEDSASIGGESLVADDRTVLRAEFTPTTEFCPQSDTLARGSYRAWNGLSERHDYDLVRVRVDGMHHKSESINEDMRDLERSYLDDGSVADASVSPDAAASTGGEPSSRDGNESGRGPTSPF
ncbi:MULTISPECIES: hypothetical protein [Halostella]|uniref:hypothetical protein n=1 Tax=Halostella TaxID=1843185 RepID=UPI001F03ECCD|nr:MULTISPECIES: hypothetical protein [Halostella]